MEKNMEDIHILLRQLLYVMLKTNENIGTEEDEPESSSFHQDEVKDEKSC
jgi:hypothetical protein